MAWIAKNSITGKTYGRSYSSIYDCQLFIDNELLLLEYEMKRVYALEKKVLKDLDDKDKSFSLQGYLMDCLKSAISELEKSRSMKKLSNSMKACLCECDDKLHDTLDSVSLIHWSEGNIIRCFNTSQNRWATGFDF